MSEQKEVRVRFAPSPTGYIHVGNARTALFNWYFARRNGGKMILRIEDTDRERSKEEYVDALVEDLKWLGMDWDEGPFLGGKFGPYRQSERFEIYQKHIDKLFEIDRAYYCFCTQEDLDKMKNEENQIGYDNRCRKLPKEEVEKNLADGKSHTVRFKLPNDKIAFDDLVRGHVEFDATLMGDPIIVRADGVPTFHLTVTIDDALMNISHVLRGEDHLANTQLHIAIAQAMGYEPPNYAHMSLTKGLSKRLGSRSLRDFRNEGYLAKALANYISLLGWSHPSGEEFFSLEDACKEFEMKDLAKSSCTFDRDKLQWMSTKYSSETSSEKLVEIAHPFLVEKGWVGESLTDQDKEKLLRVLDLFKDRVSHYQELPEKCSFIFVSPVISGEDKEIIENDDAKLVLSSLVKAMEVVEELNSENVPTLIKGVQKETGLKGKQVFMPVRIALTGEQYGPDLKLSVPLIGKEECLRRINSIL